MTTATLHDSVAAHRFVDGLTPAHKEGARSP